MEQFDVWKWQFLGVLVFRCCKLAFGLLLHGTAAHEASHVFLLFSSTAKHKANPEQKMPRTKVRGLETSLLSLVSTRRPFVDFAADLFLGLTVMLLKLTFEHLAVAVDFAQFIVSEFAPLLLNLAGQLLPVSFDLMPIHDLPPLVVSQDK
jgi:hypothetical protein